MGLKYHLSLTNSHSHSATCLPIFPKATPKTTTTSPELVRRRLPFQSSPTTTLSKAVLTLRLLTAMSNLHAMTTRHRRVQHHRREDQTCQANWQLQRAR